MVALMRDKNNHFNDMLLKQLRNTVDTLVADYLITRGSEGKKLSVQVPLEPTYPAKEDLISYTYPLLDGQLFSTNADHPYYKAVAQCFGKTHGLIYSNVHDALCVATQGVRTPLYLEENDLLKQELLTHTALLEETIPQVKNSLVVLNNFLGLPSPLATYVPQLKSQGNVVVENCSESESFGYADYVLYRFDQYSFYSIACKGFGLFSNTSFSKEQHVNLATPPCLAFGMSALDKRSAKRAAQKQLADQVVELLRTRPEIVMRAGDPGFTNFVWFTSPQVSSLVKSFEKNKVQTYATGTEWFGLPIHNGLTTEQVNHLLETLKMTLQLS